MPRHREVLGFRGTAASSSDPVRLGTTYREPDPFGVKVQLPFNPIRTVVHIANITMGGERQVGGQLQSRLRAGLRLGRWRVGVPAGQGGAALAPSGPGVRPPSAAAGRNVATWVYQA